MDFDGESLGKGQQMVLAYTRTNMSEPYRTIHMKKFGVNSSVTTLRICTTKMSKVIETKSCFEDLFSMFSFLYCIHHLVNAKLHWYM